MSELSHDLALSLVERIAALETTQNQFKEDLDKIAAGQDKLLNEFTKYKGALGMLTLLLSTLVALLGIFKEKVMSWLGWK